jgi:hypothetical protein
LLSTNHRHPFRRSALGALIATFFVASVRSYDTQVIVPATASLDVQIPVAPTPVAIGRRWCLAYELHITNYRAVDVVLTRVDVMRAADDATVLANYEGEANTQSLNARSADQPDDNEFVRIPLSRCPPAAEGIVVVIQHTKRHVAQRCHALDDLVYGWRLTSVRRLREFAVHCAAPSVVSRSLPDAFVIFDRCFMNQ